LTPFKPGFTYFTFKLHHTFVAGACSLLLIMGVGACAGTQSAIRNETVPAEASDPVWPPPPQQPRIRYLSSISGPADAGIKKSWLKRAVDNLFGTGEEEIVMLRPYDIFVKSNKLYVTDPGASIVHIFDMTEKRYFTIRSFRGGALRSPIGVAVDEHGDIYLTDSILKKVFVFGTDGAFLREIGKSDSFMRPTGIAVDKDRIYVVDTLANTVSVFAKKNGNLLFCFGRNGKGDGEFNYPTNIFIAKDGLLYIVDCLNFRIQTFNRDGNFISKFGKNGDAWGNLSKPKGVAVDSEGHIYVTDAQFENVQIFDKGGRLLLMFVKPGRGRGQMVLPAGIFIDAQDKIYIADSYNNRIQIFQYLNQKGSEGQGQG
jgi:DNA-binding beta-propeller fold protein YncE